MDNKKIKDLIDTARYNHKEFAKIQLEKEFSTLSDKAAPYIDKLLDDIEKGGLAGKVHYVVVGLPQSDFDLNQIFEIGKFIEAKPKTVSFRVKQIIDSWGVSSRFLASKTSYVNEFYLEVNL